MKPSLRLLSAAAVGLCAQALLASPAPGGKRWVGVAPGRIVSYVAARSEGGRREVWLLVEQSPQVVPETMPATDAPPPLPPCSKPGGALLTLYRGRPPGPSGLERVLDGLRPETLLHAADLDADGLDEVLLSHPGVLSRVDAASTPPAAKVLLAEEGLQLASPTQGFDGLPLLSVEPGRLRVYDGQLEAVTFPLPTWGSIQGSRLWVESPLVEPVGRSAEGKRTVATRPRPFGAQRLMTTVFELAPDGASQSWQSWGRLPEPERMLEHRFLSDGQSALLFVTTMPSGKLAIFGEKRIRLFSLEQDRSRLGFPPIFAALSGMNLWQEADPLLRDVNGDGLRDLVVAYWKGLKDDRVVLEAYLRNGDGTFRASARTTALELEQGDRSFLHYGSDLDGDGLADLLVRGASGFQLHSGRRSSDGKNLVSKTPRLFPSESASEEQEVQIEIHTGGTSVISIDGGSEPQLSDMDGDGRDEILAPRGGDDESPAALEILWIEP